jgi:hypothetical protein
MYISVLTLIVCIQVVIYKKIRRKKNSYWKTLFFSIKEWSRICY